MRRTHLLLAVLPFLACSASGAPFAADDGGLDATKDVGLDTSTDAPGPVDASKDAILDAPADAIVDATSDASVDATPDAVADASADVSVDAPVDAAKDAAIADAASDAKADAGGSVWKSPTCDGTISANEYGSASNQYTTAGGQVWYQTWDATNLYVALTNANVAEATVFYVGYTGNGLMSGQTYDSTAPGSLIFKADAVIYAKDGYNEARRVVNSAWGAATASVITFCKGGGTTRELVIPWAALGTNVIPASFRWAGYNTSAGGFVYAQMPETNPAGNIGTNTAFGHDFFVSSTNNGAGAFPFATVE